MFSYQIEASAGDAGYKKVSEVAVRGLCSKPDAEDHAGDGDRNAERNPKAWGYAESFAQNGNSEARRNVVRQATKDAYRNQPDEGPGNRQRHRRPERASVKTREVNGSSLRRKGHRKL